jgi:hypothetical protein
MMRWLFLRRRALFVFLGCAWLHTFSIAAAPFDPSVGKQLTGSNWDETVRQGWWYVE